MRPDPGESPAAASEIRLSDADRDVLAQALGRHYAEGRLDTDALSQRLDVVYAAHTREQAAAALGDLPPLAPATGSPRRGRRRHGEAPRPLAGWVPTTERFRDPTTRRLMRVWVDPTDATRHYLAE